MKVTNTIIKILNVFAVLCIGAVAAMVVEYGFTIHFVLLFFFSIVLLNVCKLVKKEVISE